MNDHLCQVLLGRLAVRSFQRVPAFRLQIGIIEIDDLAVLGVHGETQRVGIGNFIAFHLGRERMVDAHLVAIVAALQVGCAVIGPRTAGTVEGHVMGAGDCLIGIVDHDFDVLSSRCPQAEVHARIGDDGTVLQSCSFLGINGVQSLGGLYLGAGIQNTLAVGGDSKQLTLEQGLDVDALWQRESGPALELAILGIEDCQLCIGQRGLLQIETLVEGQLVISISLDAAVCVIVEVDVGGILGAFPNDGIGIDQVS